jgi:hypothetical protein
VKNIIEAATMASDTKHLRVGKQLNGAIRKECQERYIAYVIQLAHEYRLHI